MTDESQNTDTPKRKLRRAKDGATGLAVHQVTLDAESARYLREMGNGNLSLGVREAVRRLRAGETP